MTSADAIAAPTRTIRVATWNVHGCVGGDGRHDPDRTSAVLAEIGADIVALQEFRYPGDIALETRKPVVLSELDSYECALGPTLTRFGHCFGNVLLTRHPIRDVRRLDLSHKRREPRGALVSTIEVGGVPLHVLTTHLGLSLGERRFQVGKILQFLDELRSEFVVILGDFNDWLPGRTVAHELERRLGAAPRPRTFPVGWPILALDRIWVHPRRALRSLAVHVSPLSPLRTPACGTPTSGSRPAPSAPAAARSRPGGTGRRTQGCRSGT